jgi:exopolyphosphatase/guanosine-5'-triphosphate,3'-diphosphate pyrophosphatase
MAVLGRFDNVDAQEVYLKTGLEDLTRGFEAKVDTLFLVGGSWRALAQIHMARTNYPLRVLHDYVVTPIAFMDTLDFVENRTPEEIQDETQVSSTRARLLPMAAKTMRGLLALIDVHEIAFSSYGLREGLMYEKMPAEIRNSDPLIAAARAIEAGQARFPGFGDVLFNWLQPLFTTLDGSVKRLIHAACLLHDVHWRSHPDYRADVCFDAATLANLGGIDHGGRVFVAWTLLHRYKAKRVSQNYSDVRDLLQEDELSLAKTVGLAIRLGAMMSSADPDHMGRLILTPKALNLELDAQSEEVFGEVVMKRLQAVAQSIDRTATVSYV